MQLWAQRSSVATLREELLYVEVRKSTKVYLNKKVTKNLWILISHAPEESAWKVEFSQNNLGDQTYLTVLKCLEAPNRRLAPPENG